MFLGDSLMIKEDLMKKHVEYSKHLKDWTLYQTAYVGGTDFIDSSIKRHPRETEENYLMRKEEAIVFNYATSIINLLSFYLTEKDAMRDMGGLATDKQWQMFRRDCDLYNTDFNVFMNNAQKVSSIYGSAGILVDKAGSNLQNKAEEIAMGIYPYCSIYALPNIYDWAVERHPLTNRPTLTYLKLYEDGNNFLIWKLESWERWEIPTDEKGNQGDPQLIDSGENTLGEIPFFWFLNVRSPVDPFSGISDLTEIARITASIIRDLSSLQEIIKFAGFPMMRKPYKDERNYSEDLSGVRSILEFDPELPQSKPDWLESEVLEPIRGGLEFIGTKIDQIYETAHMAGVHALEKSSEARSGVALRYQFSQLSSILTEKTRNMIESEYAILRLWLMWQNESSKFDKINIRRSKQFSIDDLAQDIHNLLKVQAASVSKTMYREIQKTLQRITLPEIIDSTREEIDREIEEADIMTVVDILQAAEDAKVISQNNDVTDVMVNDNIATSEPQKTEIEAG